MIVWLPPLPCMHVETGFVWWLSLPWAGTMYPKTAALLPIPPQGCPGCSHISYSLVACGSWGQHWLPSVTGVYCCSAGARTSPSSSTSSSRKRGCGQSCSVRQSSYPALPSPSQWTLSLVPIINVLIQSMWVRDLCPQQIKSNIT